MTPAHRMAMGLGHLGQLGDWRTDLLQQGIRLGTQYAQGAVQRSQVSAAQERQLGAEFDNRAGQTTALFDRVQRQAVITQADLQMLAQAYQQLAAVAQQYATDYITEQWNSPAYRPAFEARLQQIAARVGQTTTGSGSNGSTVGTSTTGGVAEFSLSNPLVLVLLAMGGFLLLKR